MFFPPAWQKLMIHSSNVFPQLPLTLPLRLHRERGFPAFSKFFLWPLFLSGRLRFQPSKRIYAGYNQYTKDPKTFQAIILKKAVGNKPHNWYSACHWFPDQPCLHSSSLETQEIWDCWGPEETLWGNHLITLCFVFKNLEIIFRCSSFLC